MATNRDDFGIAVRYALLQKGNKQKFSLFFLICLSSFIFFLDSSNYKFIQNIRSFLNDSIYRVATVATSPFKFVSFLGESSKTHFLVYNENKSLKAELEKFKSKDFQTKYLTSQNRNLQNMLTSSKNVSSGSVVAKVILDKNSPFLKSIIVNKGSKSGVKKGMPVVDRNYLVGRTVEVNYLSSRVLMLNDLNSRIPVVIEPNDTQAIITGYSKTEPKLEYLPDAYEGLGGNTVYTSGKDGIFLPGIPVGLTVLEDDYVSVKLFSDPNQLSFVNILIVKENNN
jgi:rod shape-determining protein MreC|tara:strand:- start:1294 stop:2139 length:846 start_codon:yes stop_codon:yes gene_type:complete